MRGLPEGISDLEEDGTTWSMKVSIPSDHLEVAHEGQAYATSTERVYGDGMGDRTIRRARWIELHGWFSKVDAEAALWLEELRRRGHTPHVPGSAPSDLLQIQWHARHSAGRVKKHAEYLARPPRPVGPEVEDEADGEEE